MTVSVAVAGASGYAGGEVLRLLAQHPQVRLGALTAHRNAGTHLGEHHPHLRRWANRRLEASDPDVLAGHDVVVLALPHGASADLAAQLPPETLVLDLGADHRLERASQWEKYYGSPHAGTWTYGLPELLTSTTMTKQRDQLVGQRRIAVPGCNVTAVTLGIQPGVANGLISAQDIVAVLANGYSGAGRTLATHLLAAEGIGSAQPYAVGGTHRHIPEIVQNLHRAGATAVRLSFTPTLVPMSRGILATVSAPILGDGDPAAIRDAWQAAYADEPFVQLLPPGQWPATAMTQGANSALIQVAVDQDAGRVVTVTAIDNLVKGTAGAAIQSMNISLGLPETTGLSTEGVTP